MVDHFIDEFAGAAGAAVHVIDHSVTGIADMVIDIDGFFCPFKEFFCPGDPVFGGVKDDKGIIDLQVRAEIRDDCIRSGEVIVEIFPQRLQKYIDTRPGHHFSEIKG